MVRAIELAAEQAGVAIRSNVPVARIIIENGRAVGAVLESGEEIWAKTVVSGISPRTTFLNLVGAREIDTGFVRRINSIRVNGDAAKLHLALDRTPQFSGCHTQLNGRLVIAPSVNHVERAFNPSKYGEFSPKPVMEITLPSLLDPSLAPEGACSLSAVVQYAPYALKEGWTTGKPKFLKAILAQLEVMREESANRSSTPNSSRHYIEQRYRMPGGHWHHGELQADQMLMSVPFSALKAMTRLLTDFILQVPAHIRAAVYEASRD